MKADRRRVLQVLGNLLSNAAKHSPESSAIRVAAQREGLHAAFSVAADGRGISADLLPRLFSKFLVMCGAGNPMSVFARWRYADVTSEPSLLDNRSIYRNSNINPQALARFRAALGDDVFDDDIFYYVYGILHSPEFRSIFEANLKKERPRVPPVASRVLFDAFAYAGRELCDLHVGYEVVEPYPLVEEWAAGADPETNPAVLHVGSTKMNYPKAIVPGTGHGTRDLDRSRLRYNTYLTLAGIPPEAHDFLLGTRSGIDWLIDRYYVTTDKGSGIVNDPDQWGLERGDPRYIVDLIKRVVTVSVRTLEIVSGLPSLEETIARLGAEAMQR